MCVIKLREHCCAFFVKGILVLIYQGFSPVVYVLDEMRQLIKIEYKAILGAAGV